MWGRSFLELQTFGHIEVICGCMYSGKTEALISRLRRAELARLTHQVFKPTIDNRYHDMDVISHDRARYPAQAVSEARDILLRVLPSTKVVAVDEVQFFSDEIVEVAHQLADSGRHVILAGLDLDYLGRPFGPMPRLLATADIIQKQYAVCMVCGAPATRTQRLVENEERILLGSQGVYEARCRKHFEAEGVTSQKALPLDEFSPKPC